MTVVIEGLDVELYDGVRETTQTTGTGTYQLDGAAVVSGQTYRTFVAVANGDRVPYVVWFGSAFERGLGTVTAGAPPTLTRDLILGSSNSDNAVSWGAGVKDIWMDAPSELLGLIGSSRLDQVFTSGGTWTKSAGLKYIEVEGTGGGGGGGAVDASGANTAAGGGGGAGGIFKCRIDAAQLGGTVAVTIGAAGVAGSSGGSGGAGGTTSFGTFAVVTGGGGGAGMTASAGSGVAEGGDGGDTSYAGTLMAFTPETVRTGQRGLDGIRITGLLASKGLGGNSPYGAGGRVAGGNTGSNAGAAGAGYGSGGAGGRTSASNVAGGAGAAGVVIVRSYF